MIEQIQEFVTDKTSALTGQVEKFRKESVETVREAVAGGADNLKALKELRSATTLPVWFKPNAGLPVLDEEANPTYTVTPEQMGAEVASWVGAGASIVGGCCGTSPAHLAAIARAVKGK